MRLPSWLWTAFGVADPRPWLRECGEPAARWVTLTGVLDRPSDAAEVIVARRAVVADAGTRRGGLLLDPEEERQ